MVYCLILAVTVILLLTGLPDPTQRPYLLLGSALLLCLVLLFAWEKVAESRSPKPLAQIINSHWHADDIIVGFQHLLSDRIFLYRAAPLSFSNPGGTGVWPETATRKPLLSALAGAITGIAATASEFFYDY